MTIRVFEVEVMIGNKDWALLLFNEIKEKQIYLCSNNTEKYQICCQYDV